MVGEADSSTDLELAFAAKIIAKAKPHGAIRLLIAILDANKGKAVQNMGMANALLHHGMVLQAVRFYSAALASKIAAQRSASASVRGEDRVSK